MATVGRREFLNQQRVAAFFHETLKYCYLGHWKDRDVISNFEVALLSDAMDSSKTFLDNKGCLPKRDMIFQIQDKLICNRV